MRKYGGIIAGCVLIAAICVFVLRGKLTRDQSKFMPGSVHPGELLTAETVQDRLDSLKSLVGISIWDCSVVIPAGKNVEVTTEYFNIMSSGGKQSGGGTLLLSGRSDKAVIGRVSIISVDPTDLNYQRLFEAMVEAVVLDGKNKTTCSQILPIYRGPRVSWTTTSVGKQEILNDRFPIPLYKQEIKMEYGDEPKIGYQVVIRAKLTEIAQNNKSVAEVK